MNTEWSAFLLCFPIYLRHNQTSYLEPSPRRLLETIYRLFSPENFPFLPLSSKTWWRTHSYKPIRGGLHEERPFFLTSSWCSDQDLLAATDRMTRMELSLVWPQEQTSRDNRCHTIGLCETFRHNTSPLDRAISFVFQGIYPPAANRTFASW